MDYEKLYREANKKVAVRFGSNVAKELFPDLYESEDEKKRKEPKFKVGDRIKFKGVRNEDVTRVITNIQKGDGGGFSDYRKARRDAMFSINEQKGYAFKLQDMFDAGANWQKQQMMKNLPIWKKSKKLIEGALLDRGILYIPCYMIELSELKKLPKED